MKKLFKMDKINNNYNIYSKVFFTASSIFLIFIQTYITLVTNQIDIFGFLTLDDSITGIFCKIFIEIIIFGILDLLIFNIVHYLMGVIWIKSHKDIWVQGLWLHIHVKNNIRVGYVNIKQDFYEINAQGENISPISEDNGDYITSWSYSMGRVADDNTVRDFIGYYKAHKQQRGISNDGMHALTIERDMNNIPCVMRGNFFDTFKITDMSIDRITAEEHSGTLTLFRPSKKCLKFLKSGGSIINNIKNIPYNACFENEEYVKHLKSELNKKDLHL